MEAGEVGCRAPVPSIEALRAYAASETTEGSERRKALVPLLSHPDAESLEVAVTRLESDVARYPRSASTWNDYGALLWTRFQRSGLAFDAVQALEAIERSIALDPESPEARFNRALIAERLGLRALAQVAWKEAAELETDPLWRAEIHGRNEALVRCEPEQVRWDRLLDAGEETTPSSEIAGVFPWRTQQLLVEKLLPRLAGRSGERPEGLAAVRAAAEALRARGDPLVLDSLDAWPAADDEPLRAAIVRLGEGLESLEELRVEVGETSLRSAATELDRRGHPLRWCTELGLVIALSYRDSPAAMRRTDEILARNPPYPSIRGRLIWLRGTLLARTGALSEALDAYQAARETLQAAYGDTPACYMDVLIGEAAAFDGRIAAAWDSFVRGLPLVSRSADRRRLHSSLLAMGISLETIGFHPAARIVYAEALDNARKWGNAYGLASALRRWMIASRTFDQVAGLDATLHDAEAATLEIADERIRELTLGDLEVESARLSLHRASVSEADFGRVREVIAHFERSGSGFDVAQARLVGSQLAAALGHWQESLATIEPAVAGFRSGRARPIDRPGALGAGLSRELERQLARALQATGAVREAIESFERGRLLAAGTAGEVEGIVDKAGELALLHDASFLLLQDGEPALRFLVEPGAVRASRIVGDSSRVRRLTAGFSALDPESRQATLEELGRMLLPEDWTPTRRLVVVPDPDYDGVPFAALVHPATKAPLFATTSTALAPYLGILLRPLPEPSGELRALVVASPRATVVPLPAAREEADEVAALLHTGTVVEHPRAAELERLLESAELFHFAGHSQGHPLDPYDHELMLAPGEALGIGRILDLDLSRLRLAVLSSCDSASIVSLELPGPGFADAVLAAGAGQVVGTLWPIQDGSALAFVKELYRQIETGLLPMDAVRQTSLSQRLAETAARRQPPTWMAFRVVGRAFEPVDPAGLGRSKLASGTIKTVRSNRAARAPARRGRRAARSPTSARSGTTWSRAGW
jgi:tetratricopeptide (TPR) repeat protein